MQLLSLLGMIPAASLLLFSRRVWVGTNVRRGATYAFFTGVLGNCGNLATLQALKLGGSAAVVYPLCGMFPLVTIALARFWLGERLNLAQMVGCLIALAAIYLFSAGAEAFEASSLGMLMDGGRAGIGWVLYSLVALALFGICGVTQKLAALDVSFEASTLCWVGGSLPVALIIVLFNAPDWHIASGDWFVSALWGALVVLGMIVSFAAYKGGKAGVVTALIALYPALTVIGAVVLFGEQLDWFKGVAIALALVAGVLLTHEGRSEQMEVRVVP